MADDGKVKIAVDLDKQDLEKGIDNIGKDFKKGTKDIRKTWEQLSKETGKSFDEIKKDVDELAKKYQESGSNIPNSYKKAYKEMGIESNKAKNKAVDDAKKTSSAWKKAFSGMGSFAKLGAKATVGAIGIAGAAITGLGAIGLKYNSDMENYTTNFKVMLGSQEAALAKVEELKEFAAKTPFGMTELADATQTLLAFGVDTEKVTPALKAIGDVALGDKEKFAGLSLAFGQIQAVGKATGEDVNQMIEFCRVA